MNYSFERKRRRRRGWNSTNPQQMKNKSLLLFSQQEGITSEGNKKMSNVVCRMTKKRSLQKYLTQKEQGAGAEKRASENLKYNRAQKGWTTKKNRPSNILAGIALKALQMMGKSAGAAANNVYKRCTIIKWIKR